MSTDGIYKLLGVLGAIQEKQQQDQDAMNRQISTRSSHGRF